MFSQKLLYRQQRRRKNSFSPLIKQNDYLWPRIFTTQNSFLFADLTLAIKFLRFPLLGLRCANYSQISFFSPAEKKEFKGLRDLVRFQMFLASLDSNFAKKLRRRNEMRNALNYDKVHLIFSSSGWHVRSFNGSIWILVP